VQVHEQLLHNRWGKQHKTLRATAIIRVSLYLLMHQAMGKADVGIGFAVCACPLFSKPNGLSIMSVSGDAVM
jgi:hypothetical protein